MKLFFVLPFAVLLVLAGCGKKKVETPVNDHPISGTGTKTWHYHGEAAAGTDVEKGSKEERKATWTFNGDGSFTATEGAESMTGKWTYDGATLSIMQAGNDSTKTVFSIVTTEKDKLVLKNPDGSMMELRVH